MRTALPPTDHAAEHATDHATARDARLSTMFVRALVEAVDAMGGQVDAFVRTARIDAAALSEPYGWIDAHELERVTCEAVAFTGDEAFGLHWAERSPMTKFDLMAMATAQAPTLRDALSFVQRFQPVLSNIPELEVVARAHGVLLRVAPLTVTEQGTRVRTELLVAGIARLLRFTRTPASAIRRVSFAQRAPGHVDEYVRLFGSGVRFGAPYSGIELDPRCLDVPLDLANAELHEVLTVQAQHVIARAGSSSGYAGRVRDQLRRMLPCLPGMPEVARALDLSVRSLRRRLDEEGLSYSAILDESRLRLARRLLADPARPIKEIGTVVGFTNTPAFHRAFKRWTGESPLAYREAIAHGKARTDGDDA